MIFFQPVITVYTSYGILLFNTYLDKRHKWKIANITVIRHIDDSKMEAKKNAAHLKETREVFPKIAEKTNYDELLLIIPTVAIIKNVKTTIRL